MMLEINPIWIVLKEESPWILHLCILLLFFVLLHFGCHYYFSHRAKRLRQSKGWKKNFLQAIEPPIKCFIWIAAILLSTQILLDRFRPESSALLIKPALQLSLLGSITWFLLKWIGLSKKISKPEDLLERQKIDILSKIAHLLILFLAFLLSLQILGFGLTPLLTLSSIGGLSLGFASKDVVANFFGGLMIYITRPFVIGDQIESPDRRIHGTVEQISWYYTCVRSKESHPIYVPNAIFSTILIANLSRKSHILFQEEIQITYSSLQATQKIVEAINHLFHSSPYVDSSQEIRIRLEHFGRSSLELRISASLQTTKSREGDLIKQELLLQIARIIEEQGAHFAIQPLFAASIPTNQSS